MSGITGAWNLDGQPLSPERLSTMSGRLRHRGRNGEGRRIDGAAGFACQHNWVTPEEHDEHQPIIGRSGTMLVFDGRLDNRAQLISALDADPALSDATLVLAAFQSWDTGFAERLNGDFALALFDPSRERLLLARDAMGIRPLYYFSSPRLFAFATEIKALLAHPDIPVAPDDEGVADFMLIGSRPLDRQEITCFRNISAVVPAHFVTVTPRAVVARRYWDFSTQTALRFSSFDEYVEAFGGHFQEAVKRRARSRYPVAMSVSGGLDSSSIFCQAETLRREGQVTASAIAGVSYISDRIESDEQHFLEEIAKQYGVTFNTFALEPLTGLVGGAQQQAATIEAPFVDYMFGGTQELHTRAAATGARSLLSGHWGDQVLFSTAYLLDLLHRGAWPSIWRHTKRYASFFGPAATRRARRRLVIDAARSAVPRSVAQPLKWLKLHIAGRGRPKPWFTAAFLDSALKYRYRLATFDRPFHSAHARAVYIEARSKYHVQCMEWNNKVAASYGLDAAFPFLDRDLLGFLMAIPGEIHANDGVPRVLLREAMRGILPEKIRARTWKSDFTPFVNVGLSADAKAILQSLHADCLGVKFGYLDAGKLSPELARLAEGLNRDDCVASWSLADTYGLEMWLRVFLDPQHGGSSSPAAREY